MPYRPSYLLAVAPGGAVHATLHVHEDEPLGSGLRAGTTWCSVAFSGAYPLHVTPEDGLRWRVGRSEGRKVSLEEISCPHCRGAIKRFYR